MNINNVDFLLSKGFIARKNDNGNEIYHLNSPCSIKISAKVVASIQENYKTNEEIGGILWLTPILSSNRSFKVEKISFIRNAIEDNARIDYRNKSNAYLPDYSESSKVLKEIFDSNSLPIIFHTHPIHGTDYFTKILSSSIQTETSDADRSESNRLLTYENNNYFLPRALIVGNQVKKNNLFMGVYGGHICRLSDEEASFIIP